MKRRFLEDIAVGDAVERTVVVKEGDITAFAAVSGDTNPLHLDEEFARTTQFKGRIAHGMLTAAYLSGVLGTELPGPGGVYLSQSLNFKRPVRIGDAVTIRIRVEAIDPKTSAVTLSTVCAIGRKTVLDGEAKVMIPRHGAIAAGDA